MQIWLLLPHSCRQLSFWRESNLFSWSRGAAHTALFLQGTVAEGRGELGLDYALTVKVADPKYPCGSSTVAIRLFSVAVGNEL